MLSVTLAPPLKPGTVAHFAPVNTTQVRLVGSAEAREECEGLIWAAVAKLHRHTPPHAAPAPGPAPPSGSLARLFWSNSVGSVGA